MNQLILSFRTCCSRGRPNLRRHRQGSLIVWCAFLLVILLGMVGLVPQVV